MDGWSEVQVESDELIVDTNPDVYRKRASAATNEKRYQDALDEIEEALRYGNNDLKDKVFKAVLLWDIGNYPKCLRYLEESGVWARRDNSSYEKEIYHLYLECYRKKVNISLDEKRYQDALREIEVVLKYGKYEVSDKIVKATILYGAGNYLECLRYLDVLPRSAFIPNFELAQIHKLYKDCNAQIRTRALVALDEKRYQDALNEIETVLSYGNVDFSDKVMKAVILYGASKYSDCLRYLMESGIWQVRYNSLPKEKEQINSIYKNCHNYIKKRAKSALVEKRYQNALYEIEVALEYIKNDDSDKILKLAILWNACNYSECLRYLVESGIWQGRDDFSDKEKVQIYKLYENCHTQIRKKVMSALDKKMYPDALNEIETVLRYGKNEVSDKILKATILYWAGNYVECLRYLEESGIWQGRDYYPYKDKVQINSLYKECSKKMKDFHIGSARSAIGENRFQNALKETESAFKYGNIDVSDKVMKIKLLWKTGRYSDCLLYLMETGNFAECLFYLMKTSNGFLRNITESIWDSEKRFLYIILIAISIIVLFAMKLGFVVAMSLSLIAVISIYCSNKRFLYMIGAIVIHFITRKFITESYEKLYASRFYAESSLLKFIILFDKIFMALFIITGIILLIGLFVNSKRRKTKI